MKLRLGFVSNSSTTSFCVYGAQFDPDNAIPSIQNIRKIKAGMGEKYYEAIKKQLKFETNKKSPYYKLLQLLLNLKDGSCAEQDKQYKKLVGEMTGTDENEDEQDEYSNGYCDTQEIEAFIKLFLDGDFDVLVGNEELYTVVGLPMSALKDDETGKQFKARAEKGIQDLFGKNVKCSIEQGEWEQ